MNFHNCYYATIFCIWKLDWIRQLWNCVHFVKEGKKEEEGKKEKEGMEVRKKKKLQNWHKSAYLTHANKCTEMYDWIWVCAYVSVERARLASGWQPLTSDNSNSQVSWHENALKKRSLWHVLPENRLAANMLRLQGSPLQKLITQAIVEGTV